VHRLVYSLEKLGYLEKAETSETTAHYRLGPAFFKLTESTVHFRRLQSVARTVMANLLIRFGETVNLGVLDEGQVLYIDVLQSPSALRIAANPGQRNPMHCTALGKVFLAFLPEEEVESILEAHPLTKMTPKTITRKTELRAHLASVREQGTALDLEENLDGAVCVAAPIFDQLGQVVAGISISGPQSRMQPKLATVREELRQAGLQISSMMGAKAQPRVELLAAG
jgi:IclR family transcriptional regulator, KDG regulon repressor